MPARVEPRTAHRAAVRQIVTSSSDGEFLDHLIEGMRGAELSSLHRALEKLEGERGADIEHMCTSNHQEFVDSVNRLDRSRQECTSLGTEILNLVQSYQSSTDNLAAQKKNLVDSRNVRQNIDESAEALKECLEVLRLSNQVHDLVGKQNHYAALRALDELQTSLQMRESGRYKIGDMIEKSIPATQKMIAEAVMSDLHTWLYRIRDVSQYIGEVAFYHTEKRRSRQKERATKDDYIGNFRLNSPIELVADETEEYDILNNEEAMLQVDFTPLYECIHIHEALGQSERFRTEYAATRRKQRDLIIPTSLRLDDDQAAELKTLLESIAGFAIVERTTMRRTENLRTSADVDELWDSMCQNTITLLSNALQGVDNADTLLKVTGVVSLFIQTMECWQFYASSMNAFLLTLFERYTQVLKQTFSNEFHEIVSTDDYMPMPISDPEKYDKIIDVGWYTPDKSREETKFPVILPFSQMYPMCCIDIRNFLNQVYSAPDDYLQRSSLIDDTIRQSLDELLCEQICRPLVQRLNSQYPGQIVQILINLEHFRRACESIQRELSEARTSRSRSAPVVLRATEEFGAGREQAERRIFELVNSKIDDLIETAEYDWTSTRQRDVPSNYMTELTRYLQDVVSTNLLRLPSEMKTFIYFEALSHAAEKMLTLPLDSSITAITPAAVHLLGLDVAHLSDFVSFLPTSGASNGSSSNRASTALSISLLPSAGAAARQPSMRPSFHELSQTVALMASENPTDEFYDIARRSQRFAAVDARNGALLLEKVERGKGVAAGAAGAAGRRTPGTVGEDGQGQEGEKRNRAGEFMARLRRGMEERSGSGASAERG